MVYASGTIRKVEGGGGGGGGCTLQARYENRGWLGCLSNDPPPPLGRSNHDVN